ncbi:acetyl-CoA carboxylase biotin carboxylase subunit [Salicibibacter kimchii]|uniref:Biotin carboxylase n=1 Tax=Salicibibacter kimchii TaxID=2099786 RepID=A0A345BZE7_9BACI|nr:acetyl-CoA carboxylase biotin carboxylase subunit [Salicibibacter kimchii]AXF56328.1 acetyl-CoA carboxylase biotin carboxylase subunit [Salicibibacter kimchii]
MFGKILIANRGEIAVRIIQSCRELGVKTAAICSKADQSALHTKLADESICIGDNPSHESYLNMERIFTAAKKVNADAIHPGYGFLAENDEFVRLCEELGLAFIGPSVESIRSMGAKDVAVKTVDNAGVPTVPGSKGIVHTSEEAKEIAADIGYPVMIKAVAGGGGKGMRLAHTPEDFGSSFEQARSEADKAFGNADVYLEKYIDAPRHIEMQILGDQYGNIVNFGERECSIQRRHQKIIEEAPSPIITDDLRMEIGTAAVNAAKAVAYEGAGTVEFLMNVNGDFYFMEMNTRIQVEHPVTEMITSIDLVKEQIRVAAGEKLGYEQKDIKMNGWAMECRINAEDPRQSFQPTPGTVHTFIPPSGYQVRTDTALFSGAVITPYYDSLAAKVIVHGETREEAIIRMKRALKEMQVDGIATTIPFQLQLLEDERFCKGDFDIGFIENYGDELVAAMEKSSRE